MGVCCVQHTHTHTLTRAVKKTSLLPIGFAFSKKNETNQRRKPPHIRDGTPWAQHGILTQNTGSRMLGPTLIAPRVPGSHAILSSVRISKKFDSSDNRKPSCKTENERKGGGDQDEPFRRQLEIMADIMQDNVGTAGCTPHPPTRDDIAIEPTTVMARTSASRKSSRG